VSSGEPTPISNTTFRESCPELSPDGRWLAYRSNESNSLEVYVRPFPGPGPKRQVSIEGGTTAVGAGREAALLPEGDQVWSWMCGRMTACPPAGLACSSSGGVIRQPPPFGRGTWRKTEEIPDVKMDEAKPDPP